MNNIETMVAEFEEYRSQFRKKAQDVMRSAFTKFFTQNPNIEAIRWSQYTPYFNDGEECTFGVNDMYFRTPDMAEDAGDYDGYECSCYDSDNPSSDAVKDFVRQVRKIPDDVFKDTFGDHCDQRWFPGRGTRTRIIRRRPPYQASVS